MLLLLLLSVVVHASPVSDSSKSLSPDEFAAIVRRFHPVVRQAGLRVSVAGAGVQAARGVFDPALTSAGRQKTFDGKLYYSYFNTEVNVPTWYGVELKAGIEEVYGDRVTSEATLGKTSYAGIKLPATSLIFDKRRAQLRQAQEMFSLSEAERNLAVNDLMYEAISAYWSWVKEFYTCRVYSDIVTVSTQRLRQVKTEYVQGLRPAIDTTEALVQLQSFQLQYEGALRDYRNAGLLLATYMWLEEGDAIPWDDGITPSSDAIEREMNIATVEDMLAQAGNSHPKLLALQRKINILNIERKLKVQELLPKLSFNANVLSKGYGMSKQPDAYFLEQNHKVGFDFSMPLFLRQSRGALRASVFKIDQTENEYSLVANQIYNKVKASYNDVVTTGRQIQISGQMLSNYRRMLNGEQIRFNNGESTVFLINSRETKLLEASIKLYDLQTKLRKYHAGLLWATGSLY